MSQFSYNLNWFADFMAYVIRMMFPWEVRINQSDAYSLEQTFRKFEKRVTRSVYEVVYRGVEFPFPPTPLKTPCRGRLCSQTSFETDLISLLLSKLEPISDVTLSVKRKNDSFGFKNSYLSGMNAYTEISKTAQIRGTQSSARYFVVSRDSDPDPWSSCIILWHSVIECRVWRF